MPNDEFDKMELKLHLEFMDMVDERNEYRELAKRWKAASEAWEKLAEFWESKNA